MWIALALLSMMKCPDKASKMLAILSQMLDNTKFELYLKSSHSIHRHYEIIQSERREYILFSIPFFTLWTHILTHSNLHDIFHFYTNTRLDVHLQHTKSIQHRQFNARFAAAAIASVHKYILGRCFFHQLFLFYESTEENTWMLEITMLTYRLFTLCTGRKRAMENCQERHENCVKA